MQPESNRKFSDEQYGRMVGGTGSYKDSVPQTVGPDGQITQQMSSVTMSIDQLESLVSELVRRLKDVTLDRSERVESSGVPVPPLCPLASRLSQTQARINNVCDIIQAQINCLEI